MKHLDSRLEEAFWRFDALHKAHYRDANPRLPGPMSERDAFKLVVSEVLLGVPQSGTGDRDA